MAEIEIPDAGDEVAAYLYAETGHPAGVDVPNPAPTEFAEVIITGGGRVNTVTEAVMVTVACTGATRSAAYAHARAAALALDRLKTLGGHRVHREDVVGRPAWSPDPDTDRPRFQLTVTFQYRNTKAP